MAWVREVVTIPYQARLLLK